MIQEILLRLPVKCLLRFKCVCKSWCTLISNPEFAKLHFDLAATPTHRLIAESLDHAIVSCVDVDDFEEQVVLQIPLPSPEDADSEALIVGSCRGFILIMNLLRTHKFFGCVPGFVPFVLWNPSTGKEIRIRKKLQRDASLCGIGYDSSADDYFLVIVLLPQNGLGQTEVHCYSFRTNSWSSVECNIGRHDQFGHRHGWFLNESLHWLVESFESYCTIIAFNVRKKILSEISLPCDLAMGLDSATEICNKPVMKGRKLLRVMGRCLCVCVVEDWGRSAMWMMKEYDEKSSWTKSYIETIDNDQIFFNVFPLYFTNDGDVVGTPDEFSLG